MEIIIMALKKNVGLITVLTFMNEGWQVTWLCILIGF